MLYNFLLCFQLQRFIHMILENLSSLFESLIVDIEEKDSSLVNPLDEKIPSLCRLRKLAGTYIIMLKIALKRTMSMCSNLINLIFSFPFLDLLDMPLKSITETWENGELSSCGFTAYEVRFVYLRVVCLVKKRHHARTFFFLIIKICVLPICYTFESLDQSTEGRPPGSWNNSVDTW